MDDQYKHFGFELGYYFFILFINFIYQMLPSFTIITKIARRSKNEVNTTTILSRNRGFERKKLSFNERFKGNFDVKTERIFEFLKEVEE